jgi:hypothetical protein
MISGTSQCLVRKLSRVSAISIHVEIIERGLISKGIWLEERVCREIDE